MKILNKTMVESRVFSEPLKNVQIVHLNFYESASTIGNYVGANGGGNLAGFIYSLGQIRENDFGAGINLRFGNRMARFFDPPTSKGYLEGQMKLNVFFSYITAEIDRAK